MSNEVQVEATEYGMNVPSDEPNQNTFSLDDFIQEKSTVPTVGVTVFFDADGGMQLEDAQNALDEAQQHLAVLETMQNPVLAVGEENPLLNAKNEAEAKQAAAQKQIDALTERVLSSALYIEFQVKDAKQVVDSQQAAREALPEDYEESMAASKIQAHFLDYCAAAVCIRMTNVRQQTIEGPFTVETMSNLRNKLIQTEGNKLMAAMNKAIGVSSSWSEKLDAGFPGGSTHVAG